jgi:general secretion pathway protein K
MTAQRGIALVIVLWTIALLSVMAAGFAMSMRTQTRLTHNQVASAQAKAVAEAGVQRAILEFLKPDQEQLWKADGSYQRWDLAGAAAYVSVLDESGKVDLNTAQDELLRGLLRVVGVEDEALDTVVDSIQDWKDPDDLQRANGAEQVQYEGAGLRYGPKNAPFESVEELQQVLHVTPALYRRLYPFVTVHSQQPGINPLVAPREVLLAVPGWDAAQVDSYLSLRSQFTPGLPQPTPTLPQAEGGYLTARSTLTYGIVSIGSAPQGAVATIRAVVRITRSPQQPATVLAWREAEPLPVKEQTEDVSATK